MTQSSQRIKYEPTEIWVSSRKNDILINGEDKTLVQDKKNRPSYKSGYIEKTLTDYRLKAVLIRA